MVLPLRQVPAVLQPLQDVPGEQERRDGGAGEAVGQVGPLQPPGEDGVARPVFRRDAPRLRRAGGGALGPHPQQPALALGRRGLRRGLRVRDQAMARLVAGVPAPRGQAEPRQHPGRRGATASSGRPRRRADAASAGPAAVRRPPARRRRPWTSRSRRRGFGFYARVERVLEERLRQKEGIVRLPIDGGGEGGGVAARETSLPRPSPAQTADGTRAAASQPQSAGRIRKLISQERPFLGVKGGGQICRLTNSS